jgi:DNA-binding protein HU-beta
MWKNPEKSGFRRIFSFTAGLPIPYHLVANAGFRRFSVGADTHVQPGESEKRRIMAATKMTQSQLIKELAAAVEVPNKTAKAFTMAYAEMAIKETKKNGVAVLPGIGRLVRVDRKARIGRNPATGEAIKIPAKKVVKFRVAKAVKDSIVPPKVKK